MLTARQVVIELCVQFEGVRLKPYRCPAGVPTIGVGSTHYEDGTPVKMTDPPITLARARALLERDVDAFLHESCRMSPGLRTLANHLRRAAVADFIYNLGSSRYRASTLRRKVEAGDWPAAAEQLGKWVWGGGRKLPGLIKRRAAEARLMLTKGL